LSEGFTLRYILTAFQAYKGKNIIDESGCPYPKIAYRKWKFPHNEIMPEGQKDYNQGRKPLAIKNTKIQAPKERKKRLIVLKR